MIRPFVGVSTLPKVGVMEAFVLETCSLFERHNQETSYPQKTPLEMRTTGGYVNYPKKQELSSRVGGIMVRTEIDVMMF